MEPRRGAEITMPGKESEKLLLETVSANLRILTYTMKGIQD
jgi:hypothetical protein